MKLINSTVLPASLRVAELSDKEIRVGVACAKATFRFEFDGSVALERDDPIELFPVDKETELGLFPRDDLPAVDQRFDVIVLGKAHAPRGRAVRMQTVTLRVGDHRRELRVYGDRHWMGSGSGAVIGAPEPFMSMPLTYERAFGGRADIWLDRESPVEVSHPANPDGKGFDVEREALQLAQALRPPTGYPAWERAPRPLPNLEHPDRPVTRWSDAPMPACWATVPLQSAPHMMRSFDGPTEFASTNHFAASPLAGFTSTLFHRASDDWLIEVPPPRAPVVMEGLFADASRVEFRLPHVVVDLDVAIGEQRGSMRVGPSMLVLLPEERRFYIVYRSKFRFAYRARQARSTRLRAELRE